MKKIKKKKEINTGSVDLDPVCWVRNKQGYISVEERKLLLKLVNLHRDIMFKKVSSYAIIKQKQLAWQTIHKMYLERTKVVGVPRTVKQLQRCYHSLKGNAKKGVPLAVKLMQWADEQYNLEKGKTLQRRKRVKRSANSLQAVGKDFDREPRPDNEPKDKQGEIQNPSEQSLDENVAKLKEALTNSECTHCTCEKIEKNAKVQLMVLQKRLNEELHELEMQVVNERLRNQRELHKLRVHEMSIKIENQRRRAEILDKELGN